jgi:hypothetical protein
MTIIMTLGATVMVESSQSSSLIPTVCLWFITIINKVNPSSFSPTFPLNHIRLFLFQLFREA